MSSNKGKPLNLSALNHRLKRALEQAPYLGRALGFVWQAARQWTLAWIGLLILQGLLPVASVYLTRYLVNQLVSAVEMGLTREAVQLVLVPLILMVAVMLLTVLLNSLANWIRTTQAEKVQDYMSALVHQKSSEVDLAFYDLPEFYDRLHRARSDAGYRPIALLESMGSLVQNGITMVSMMIVLIPFGLWVPVLLLFSTLPIFYVVIQHRMRLYRWRLENTPIERRSWYYEWLLTQRPTAAELRLFQLSGHFKEKFQNLRTVLRQERSRLARNQSLAELAASMLSLLITGAAMIWMLLQTVANRYTLGDAAFFYQAFFQGQSLARSLLENVGEIYSNSLFLSDLFEFLSLEPQIADSHQARSFPNPLQQGITFDKVKFAYPGSTKAVLDGFDLSVQAGQMVAIVGPNGAGKSTLIRLLCRFYDPQAGSIFLDGIDLRQISLDSLRRSTTVLFQEPVQYNETARQNIALGDITQEPTLPQVSTAAHAAGADQPISRLPEGYDTLLGRWFEGGTELSLGEWQRLALARAFLRQAPLIILDEPTSAMDPWSEVEWLERFRSLAQGKTAILITHRFTTAAHADLIYVMQEGRIVESGKHVDLIARGGLYAQSWQAQLKSLPV